MKTNFLFLSMICLLIMACSEDPQTNTEPEVGNEHFTCMVDNESFSATDIGSFALKEHDGPQTTRVFGSRDVADTNEKLFSIKIDDSLETDIEYPLDEDHFWASLNDGEDQYSSLPIVGGSGLIKITNRTDTQISGAFSFTLFNIDNSGGMIIIEDGSFDVEYQ